MSLITAAEAKTALGISSATTDQDALIDRAIEIADDTARGYTGRHLTSAQFTETFYAPQRVTLREWPVASLDSVSQDGAALVPGDLRVDLARGRIWRPDGAGLDWTNTNTLTVVYTAGYTTTPADLREWCFLLVKSKWDAWADSRGLEPGGAQLSRVQYPDGGAESFVTAGAVGGTVADLPDYLAGVPLSALDRYRDPTPAISDEYSIWIAP